MDVLERMSDALETTVVKLGAALRSSESIDDAVAACSAAMLCTLPLVGFEAASKSPREMQTQLCRSVERIRPVYEAISAQISADDWVRVMEPGLRLFEAMTPEGISLGCGHAMTLAMMA
eukprot:COSAG06_NODE_29794_length_550_cov_0.915743_1_plen_118_part_01